MQNLITISVLATALYCSRVMAQEITPPDELSYFKAPVVISTEVNREYCLGSLSDSPGYSVTIDECKLYSDDEADIQTHKWTFKDGVLKLYTDECLHVSVDANGQAPDGTKVVIQTCETDSGSPAQKWSYKPVDHQFKLVGTDKCLSLTDFSVKDGDPDDPWVQVSTCPDEKDARSKWLVEDLPGSDLNEEARDTYRVQQALI